MYSGNLPPNDVFVFGSNLKGIHGKGAALVAKQYYGAIDGIGYGRMGRCFAIPTKMSPYVRLDLKIIQHYVNCFLDYLLLDTGDSIFHITPIGCGLASYEPIDIAPLFEDIVNYPSSFRNVKLPEEFLLVLNGPKVE